MFYGCKIVTQRLLSAVPEAMCAAVVRGEVHVQGRSEVKVCLGSFSTKDLIPGLIEVYVKIVVSQHEMSRLGRGHVPAVLRQFPCLLCVSAEARPCRCLGYDIELAVNFCCRSPARHSSLV